MNIGPDANRAGLLCITQQQQGTREIQMDLDWIGSGLDWRLPVVVIVRRNEFLDCAVV